MEDQELFTELKNLFPFPSSDVSKLTSTCRILEICMEKLRKMYQNLERLRVPFLYFWSKYPKIGFGDIYYEYLQLQKGDFQNFDFLQNGGHFKAIFRPFFQFLAKKNTKKWPPFCQKSKFSKSPL